MITGRLSRAVLAGGIVISIAGCGNSSPSISTAARTTTVAASSSPVSPPATATTTTASGPGPKPPRSTGRIRERVVSFVDRSRTVRVPGRGTTPRKLVTVIRYPVGTGAPLPLVVFGHGFAVTPRPYAGLLEAWARAGYVVAAPIFPLGNANAPGGPNESDIVNQPRDMRFVISRMLAASAARHGFLAGRVDRHRIALAGQSDGGETALAVAYDRYYLDRRVDAAIILSGAEIPGVRGFDFPAPSPPLLATQGTADTTNRPSSTSAFFDSAPAPKYLLLMLGAGHLGPYTNEQPQLGIVERVTIAFLNRYLKGDRSAVRQMRAAGNVSGISALRADP